MLPGGQDAKILQFLKDGLLVVDQETGHVYNNKGKQLDKNEPDGRTGKPRSTVNYKSLHASTTRILWLAAFGEITPGSVITVKNGDNLDTRFENLTERPVGGIPRSQQYRRKEEQVITKPWNIITVPEPEPAWKVDSGYLKRQAELRGTTFDMPATIRPVLPKAEPKPPTYPKREWQSDSIKIDKLESLDAYNEPVENHVVLQRAKCITCDGDIDVILGEMNIAERKAGLTFRPAVNTVLYEALMAIARNPGSTGVELCNLARRALNAYGKTKP